MGRYDKRGRSMRGALMKMKGAIELIVKYFKGNINYKKIW